MHRSIPLTLTLTLAVLLVAGLFVSSPASAAAPVRVLHGSTPSITAVFPNDRFTVADPRQVTGRRVHLPVPPCTVRTFSTCDSLGLLNQLDGFDIQPLVYVPFSGPIDIRTVGPRTVWVQG